MAAASVGRRPGRPQSGLTGHHSVLQDAQAHHRWHPIGDGYTPRPGDWVLFDEHVEVVTNYADGVLYTIGGDSGSNLSVNAHQYDGPLAGAGVAGFVNNGELASAVSQSSGSTQAGPSTQGAAAAGDAATASGELAAATQGQASVPGLVPPALSLGSSGQAAGQQAKRSRSRRRHRAVRRLRVRRWPGPRRFPVRGRLSGTVTSYSAAALERGVERRPRPAPSNARYSRSQPPPRPSRFPIRPRSRPSSIRSRRERWPRRAVRHPGGGDHRAGNRRIGLGPEPAGHPGQQLVRDQGHRAGRTVLLPTEEYENGQPVGVTAAFRVYSNVAQSIADHSLLLATGSSYKQAMADRRSPDAFANDLTGVYATDPNYGASLIGLMRQYNLYRFDAGASTPQAGTAAQGTAATSVPSQAKATGGGSAQSTPAQSSPAQSSPAEGAAIPGAIAVNGAVLGVAAHQATGEVTSGRGAAGSDAAQGSWSRPAFRVCWTRTLARPRRPAASGAQVGPNTGRAVQPARARRGSVPGVMCPGAADRDHRLHHLGQGAAAAGRADLPGRGGEPTASAGSCWPPATGCSARPSRTYSPVYGETLGTENPDGTIYRSKSEALDQCRG